jgi:hypothetical protein
MRLKINKAAVRPKRTALLAFPTGIIATGLGANKLGSNCHLPVDQSEI